MFKPAIRAALFIDFENLYTTLKNLQKQGHGDFGASPSIDFEALVDYVHQQVGELSPMDTYAAANFSHYNQQLGGLNRLSQIIAVDSFEPPRPHHPHPHFGKKHVVHNFSDMALAYQAGRHAAQDPADIYLFVSGDGAFAAVADALQQSGLQVQFILPDPASAHHILTERYLCIPFQDTQPRHKPLAAPPPAQEEVHEQKPYQEAVEMIAAFRREFSTAIPAALVKAALGPASAGRLLDHARSEQAIDMWESDTGVACVSLQGERLYGKVIKMEPRPVFVEAAGVLFTVARLAESPHPPLARADWRKAIKEKLSISNTDAKNWLGLLLDCAILQDSRIQRPDMSLAKLKNFLTRAEAARA